jgi:hypothetical protein
MRNAKLQPRALAAATPERQRQGKLEMIPRAIPDDAGRPSQPFRAVDTLALMRRKGTITAEMHQAGEDFRSMFRRAQLDPLHAPDISRPVVSGTRPSDGPAVYAEHARRRVHAALLAVGGMGSPGGSCLWHVVGWERSLKEWALTQGWGSGRRLSQEAASGVLIAALAMLAGQRAGVAT